MASEVSICNSALLELGEDSILALADDSKRARLCNQRYPELRDALYAMFPWKFATKRVSLPQISAPPLYGFTTHYQLPADYIKLIAVNDTLVWYAYQPESFYRIEGRTLLYEESPCYIRYVARITDPNLMTPLFRELLSLYLAYKLAKSITDDRNLRKDLREEFTELRSMAQWSDSVEELPGYIEADTFINARA